MRAFRWPEMEERIRGVLREDAARWKRIRAERRRRKAAARPRDWWVLAFFSLPASVVFFVPMLAQANIEGTLLGAALFAFFLANCLVRTLLGTLFGPAGKALLHTPAPTSTIIHGAWAETRRSYRWGLLVLIFLHSFLLVRTRSIVGLWIPIGEWIMTVAAAAHLMRWGSYRWGRILGMVALFASLVAMVCLRGPTPSSCAWLGWLGGALAVPAVALVALIPRNLRRITWWLDMTQLGWDERPALQAPAARRESPSAGARIRLAAPVRCDLVQRMASRILSEREQVIAGALIPRPWKARLNREWASLALAGACLLAGVAAPASAHIAALYEYLHYIRIVAGYAVGGLALCAIYLPFHLGVSHDFESVNRRSDALLHLPLGLWEVARVSLKLLLVTWLLWLPVAACIAIADASLSDLDEVWQTARIALGLLVLMPLCAVEHAFMVQQGGGGRGHVVAWGANFPTAVGLLGGAFLLGPWFPRLKLAYALALLVWAALCWLILELWSRRGHGDQVFPIRSR